MPTEAEIFKRWTRVGRVGGDRCGTLRNHPDPAAVDEFNRFAAGTLTGSVAGGGERHSFYDFGFRDHLYLLRGRHAH